MKYMPEILCALVIAFVLSGGLTFIGLGPDPARYNAEAPGVTVEPPPPGARHTTRKSAYERFAPIHLQCVDHTWTEHGRVVARQTRC